MLGRAEMAQAGVRFTHEIFDEPCRQSRLPDARLARKQHDAPLANFGLVPAPIQQRDLLLATNEGRFAGAERLEPAQDAALADGTPSALRFTETFDLNGTEETALEEVADELTRACVDQDRVRLGEVLQSSGYVRGFADDRLLLRGTGAQQIADDDETGSDADAAAERRSGVRLQRRDCGDDIEPGHDRALSVVLVRLRIAEVDEDAVAHVLRDKPADAADRLGDMAMIGTDHLAKILGIEPCRQSCR